MAAGSIAGLLVIAVVIALAVLILAAVTALVVWLLRRARSTQSGDLRPDRGDPGSS